MGAEFALSFFITICFVAWAEKYGGSAVLNDLLQKNRGALYGTFASIFGSLLGFAITTVSIALGFSQSEQLRVVRESKHYPTLWKVFLSAIKVLGAATIASLIALLVDRDNTPNSPILYICFFLLLLSVFRIVRSIWVLEQIIVLVTAPSKSKTGSE